MQTLVTLDLAHGADGSQIRLLDFDDATRIHKLLIGAGVRLGQPVKCVKLDDGRWGATLRVGISMPQLVRLSALDDADVANRLGVMMQQIKKPLVELL
jgi:hypothetical protein